MIHNLLNNSTLTLTLSLTLTLTPKPQNPKTPFVAVKNYQLNYNAAIQPPVPTTPALITPLAPTDQCCPPTAAKWTKQRHRV